MAVRPYRKLTGLYRAVGTMSQLWLGADHLLHVNSTGYTENYRRLYLRDIQAMLLVHTNRRLYLHLALLVIAGLFAMIFQMTIGTRTPLVVIAIVAAPLFLWNQLLGGGCRVVVVTAVQQENVPSLSRVPKARRVIAELSPLILAAQAQLATGPDPEPPPLEASPGEPPAVPPPLPIA